MLGLMMSRRPQCAADTFNVISAWTFVERGLRDDGHHKVHGALCPKLQNKDHIEET